MQKYKQLTECKNIQQSTKCKNIQQFTECKNNKELCRLQGYLKDSHNFQQKIMRNFSSTLYAFVFIFSYEHYHSEAVHMINSCVFSTKYTAVLPETIKDIWSLSWMQNERSKKSLSYNVDSFQVIDLNFINQIFII